jgi:hypothetical protein
MLNNGRMLRSRPPNLAASTARLPLPALLERVEREPQTETGPLRGPKPSES